MTVILTDQHGNGAREAEVLRDEFKIVVEGEVYERIGRGRIVEGALVRDVDGVRIYRQQPY